MQVNKAELVKILENGERIFLSSKPSTKAAKPLNRKFSTFFPSEYPYYVGPLNSHSDKAWLVRNKGKNLSVEFRQNG